MKFKLLDCKVTKEWNNKSTFKSILISNKTNGIFKF